MSSSSSSTSASSSMSRSLKDLVKQWTVGRVSASKNDDVVDEEDEEDARDATTTNGGNEDGGGALGNPSERRVLHLPEPTPTTPVGLKPRRSVSSLKMTLGIRASPRGREANHEEDENHRSALASVPRRGRHHDHVAFPPPPAGPPPSSTATISSPIISTSSFYPSTTDNCSILGRSMSSSASQQQQVAASPVLLPGHARTAVGALVAATAAAASSMKTTTTTCGPGGRDASTSPIRPIMMATTSATEEQVNQPHPRAADLMNRSLQSILPPFDDVDYYQYSGGRSRRYVADVPPRGLGMAKLLDLNSLSPVRPRGRVSASVSPSHSIVASPSSLAGDLLDEPAMGNRSAHPMDFLNGMLDDDDSNSNVGSIRDENRDDRLGFRPHEATTVPRAQDLTMQKQKFNNQRQAHEDLILAALERLQDEKDLVGEIQRQLGHDEISGNPSESLLEGLSVDTARRISTTLIQILKELDVTEQLLFSSPTDMAAVSIPRNDFRDAIRFCLQLVRTSTSTSTSHRDLADGDAPEMSKWKLLSGIKSSLGLIPESPQMPHRGGDTSVFSVPCDDSVATPMTSNVSISTTITTRTHLTAANVFSPNHAHYHPPPRFHHQALEIRHTIATVATLLDRLSRLLTRDKLPTQEIKRVYMEMQTLDVASLKSVVEAFEIDQPDPLVMLLSGSSASQDDDLSDVVPPPPDASVFVHRLAGASHLPTPEPSAQRQHAQQDQFFSPILRSQSGNRLDEEELGGAVTELGKVRLASAAPQSGVEAKGRFGGRRPGGGSRRGGGGHYGLFRRPSLKLQDPLNLS